MHLRTHLKTQCRAALLRNLVLYFKTLQRHLKTLHKIAHLAFQKRSTCPLMRPEQIFFQFKIKVFKSSIGFPGKHEIAETHKNYRSYLSWQPLLWWSCGDFDLSRKLDFKVNLPLCSFPNKFWQTSSDLYLYLYLWVCAVFQIKKIALTIFVFVSLCSFPTELGKVGQIPAADHFLLFLVWHASLAGGLNVFVFVFVFAELQWKRTRHPNVY